MQAASAADRLRVDHREAEVELAAPVELAVGVDDVRPVRVGRRQHEVAGGGGAVALAGGASRSRSRRPASSRARSGLNATTSCPPVTSLAIRSAASLDSAPVVSSSAFSSGSGSDSASRRDRSTTGRESIPLKRWSSVAGHLAQRRRDRGMRVAEDRAHLARGEVEDLAPVAGVQDAARGPLDDRRDPRGAVADDVAVDVGPERRVQPGFGEKAHARRRYRPQPVHFQRHFLRTLYGLCRTVLDPRRLRLLIAAREPRDGPGRRRRRRR